MQKLYRKKISPPGTLPRIAFWSAAPNFAAVKSSEILTEVGIGVLQKSDTSFDMSKLTRSQHPLILRF